MAFYMVYHSLLLIKLCHMNLPARFIDLTQNYLSDRYQRVCYNEFKSHLKSVTSGVRKVLCLALLLCFIPSASSTIIKGLPPPLLSGRPSVMS